MYSKTRTKVVVSSRHLIIIIISFHCGISTYHISGSLSAGTHTHYLYINSFHHTALLTVLIFAEENRRSRTKTLVA